MSRTTPSQSRTGDGLKLAFIAVLTSTVVVIVGTIIGEAPNRDATLFGIAYVLLGLCILSGGLYAFLERKTLLRRANEWLQSVKSKRR